MLCAKDYHCFWAQRKRGKTALFKPLMKCHLQFTSMAFTWRIHSTPGLHRLMGWGCVISGGTFLEGEKMHKSIETQLLCPQGLGAVFAMAAAAR